MIRKILFLLVLFFANTIQAITGFAGTVLAMPPSMRLIGVDEAKVVLNVMAWLSCLFITCKSYKYMNHRELLKMSGCMLIGMIAGIQVYRLVSTDILLPAYGIFILAVAIIRLVKKDQRKLSRWILLIVLFAAGIIHGMYVSGGALLVVYAAQVLPDKEEFRATVAPVWVVLNTILMVTHIREGAFTNEVNTYILMSIVPLIIATVLGSWLQKKINQKLFLKLTYILLVITGLSRFF